MKKKILFCIVCAMASMAMACNGVDAEDGEIKMAVKSGRLVKSCHVLLRMVIIQLFTNTRIMSLGM